VLLYKHRSVLTGGKICSETISELGPKRRPKILLFKEARCSIVALNRSVHAKCASWAASGHKASLKSSICSRAGRDHLRVMAKFFSLIDGILYKR